MVETVFGLSVFVVGALFYLDLRFNDGKIVTKLARKFF